MNLPVLPGTIPGGFCPSTWQDVLNAFAANMSVTLNLSSGVSVVISVNKPSDTSVVWKRIDALGRYQGDYIFGQGAWLRLHPIQPGATVWYFQALPDFTSYDGGDGLTAGIQSGPMWQQAKDVNNNVITAKFLIAAGTLPSGTVLANGATGGEENHLLIVTEGATDPNHAHVVGIQQSAGNNQGFIFVEATSNTSSGTVSAITSAGGSVGTQDISTLTGQFLKTGIIDPTPATIVAHNTMPLYVTGFLLQRTNRLYYAVN